MAAGLYIGLMSGTSMDGIDAVLVRFAPKLEILGHHQQPLPPSLLTTLHGLCHAGNHELDYFARADRTFAEVCAEAVRLLLQQSHVPASAVRAIGSHGQTIRHQPYAEPAYTIQLGDPNTLAVLTGIDVVADFRRKDIALGGQGAPLVPAFHQALFAHEQRRLILNLGGIANITYLPGPASAVLGFDTGPANTLLDQWFQLQHPDSSEGFDRDGAFAAAGRVSVTLLERLMQHPFLTRPAPKSTGRDEFHLNWLQQQLSAHPQPLSAADVQATLEAFTIASIQLGIAQLPGAVDEVWVCGGGAHNPRLMRGLQQALALPVASTAVLGVDPQRVEALAFAWLAQRYLLQLPGNLPAVTGAQRAAVLGALYPAT